MCGWKGYDENKRPEFIIRFETVRVRVFSECEILLYQLCAFWVDKKLFAKTAMAVKIGTEMAHCSSIPWPGDTDGKLWFFYENFQ